MGVDIDVLSKSLVGFVSYSCHFECDVMSSGDVGIGVCFFEFDQQIGHGDGFPLLDFTFEKSHMVFPNFGRNGLTI